MLPRPQVEPQNDVALIIDSRAGDRSAFAELWRRHRDAALRTAWPLGQSEAEDIVAEAFTLIWVQLRNGKGPREHFRAYALTTVRNIAARRYRDRQRTLTGVELDGEDVPGGDRLFEVSENQQQILAAFETLPDRWRQILWWMEVDEVARSEVAERLGLSPNSVSALMRRAREGLRIAWMQQQLPDATKLEHADLAYQLPKYIRGGLGEGRVLEMQQHLRDCAQCRGIERDLKRENHRLGGSFVTGAVAGLAGIAVVSTTLIRPEPALAAAQPYVEALDSSAKALAFSKSSVPVGAGVAALGAGAMSLWLLLSVVLGGVDGQLPATGKGPTPVGVAAEAAEQPESTPPETEVPAQEDDLVHASTDEQAEVRGSSVEGTPSGDPRPTAPTLVDPLDPVDPQWPFVMQTENGKDGAIAPQLSGTSTPGSQLGVSVAGLSYTVPVAMDGSWTTDLATLPLGPRSHAVVLTRVEGGNSLVVGQLSFSLNLPDATARITSSQGLQMASISVSGLPGAQACVELGPNVYQRMSLDGSGWGSAQVPVISGEASGLTVRYCDGSRFGPAGPVRGG